MRFDNLAAWLRWQETLHPQQIDLRLNRVGSVWARLGPARMPCPVITVGGTNGKGSCVAFIDSLFRAGGYRTCAYTSPHLLRYNERIRVDGQDADDAAICAAFARVDAARGADALTYFEFGTLAALDLFVRAEPDLIILEVGLGGRLDAVNVLDADVAVVTSIGMDHCIWLGDTLSQIAFEKAGIFRAGRPALIGQRDAPPRLRQRAEEIGARPLQLGREFDARIEPGQWHWRGPDGARRMALPPPPLRGRVQYDNAASALAAAQLLSDRLPLGNAAVRQGLLRTVLPGRFTVLPGRPVWLLDVAHNVPAAAALAENLRAYPCAGHRHAVFAPLADKDAAGIAACLAGLVDHWHLAPAPASRAMPLDDLRRAVARAGGGAHQTGYGDLAQAIQGAAALAGADDCLLAFGSFMTVEGALRNPLVAPV